MHIILLSIVDNSDNNLLILFLSLQQTNQLLYFRNGKFCLFMMHKLNVKWPVMQTEEQ